MKVAFSEHTFDNALFRGHFGENIAQHEESIRAGYALEMHYAYGLVCDSTF